MPERWMQDSDRHVERCVLVGLDLPDEDWPIEESLAELSRLAESAGAVPCGHIVQARTHPDPAYFVGRGKLDELAEVCQTEGADLVIFDDELSPAQARNIERALDIKVLDRTQLILDIFAQRAKTREGKLQVELAQLQYLLPRLSGIGTSLSRLGGGIGTRGPGETKLEADRRRIRSRMADLRSELEDVRRHRDVQRQGRRGALSLVAALVGYTNAGKSTLLNALTGAQAYADDRLFATLDPTVRQVSLPRGGSLLLVDTVGFIRKLPHDLVAAFRATLEEVTEADVLIHVVDLSSPEWYEQSRAVYDVLQELGAAERPIITAFNKIDLVDPATVQGVLGRTRLGVALSAKDGVGFDALLRLVEDAAPDPLVKWEFVVPYAEAHVASWIHEHGRVLSEAYAEDGIRLEALLRRPLAGRVLEYRAER